MYIYGVFVVSVIDSDHYLCTCTPLCYNTPVFMYHWPAWKHIWQGPASNTALESVRPPYRPTPCEAMVEAEYWCRGGTGLARQVSHWATQPPLVWLRLAGTVRLGEYFVGPKAGGVLIFWFLMGPVVAVGWGGVDTAMSEKNDECLPSTQPIVEAVDPAVRLTPQMNTAY